MRIHEIQLDSFMNYKSSVVQLPERGIVLVTGANGSGKSSLVEAAAWGGWAKTIRRERPWTTGIPCQVKLKVEGAEISRGRTKSDRPTLDWSPTGKSVTFDTSAKGQPELERVIGSFDVWRRTHVFSSIDAAHFSVASDTERKTLIESIVGNDRFDIALKLAKVDLQTAERELQDIESKLGRVQQTRTFEARRLDDLRASLEDQPRSVADVTADLEKVDAEISKRNVEFKIKKQRLQSLQDTISKSDDAAQDIMLKRDDARCLIAELETAGDEHQAEIDTLGRIQKGASEPVCSECGRESDDLHVSSIEEKIKEQRVLVTEAKRLASPKITLAKEEIERLNTALGLLPMPRAEAEALERDIRAQERDSSLLNRRAALAADLETAKRAAEARARIETSISKSESDLDELDDLIDSSMPKIAVRRHALSVLTATESVLGVRGVRAHVIRRTLETIEAITNSILDVISDHAARIRLKSYAEKKTGGVNDAISIDVIGYGGDVSYRACSAGQRRQIDVALLLALGLVEEASQGLVPGTLFFDEVFDVLDIDGTRNVLKILEAKAQDRCVVLISHSAVILEEIQPVLHFHIEAGRIFEL